MPRHNEVVHNEILSETLEAIMKFLIPATYKMGYNRSRYIPKILLILFSYTTTGLLHSLGSGLLSEVNAIRAVLR
jgi:hypothetical protein